METTDVNEKCICPRLKCPRHGKCEECRAHHGEELSYCERAKLKAERREHRKRDRGR